MKRGIVLLSVLIVFSLLAFSLVIAEENDTNDTTTDDTPTIDLSLQGVEKAYACLENKLETDCDSAATAEQAALSLLAISYDSSLQSKCKSSLMNYENTNCFSSASSGSCDLKSTAQAILALDNIGVNTEDYTDWLLEQKKLTTDLDWFLEIDANEETTCSVDGADFKISNEKKFTSGSSNCLTRAESNYYLKIGNSEACLNKNFTISCDRDFITTLLYKIDSTYYVSSKTNSAPASGKTQEKVNSYCFSTSSTCDYQGSLWASLALAKTGNDISGYLPYLSSQYENLDNKKYFPSSFLCMLTQENDYCLDVGNKQKQEKYWNEQSGSAINYYDTALALLSLQDLFLEEVDNAKENLLVIQDTSGCWSNTKDTAFILYAGWPKAPTSSGGDSNPSCTSFSKYCVARTQCASPLNNYDCSGMDVCCDVAPLEKSCDNQGGAICSSEQECTSALKSSSDGPCCLTSCELVTENECISYSTEYSCETSCSDDEDEKFLDCDFSGDSCCAPKEDSGGNWLLIILLVVLIILVILAIIFRNQLKVWWFKFKSKLKIGKHKPGPSARPPMTTMPQQFRRPRQIMPRQGQPYRRPPARRPAQRARKPQKDSAFDDTMKKLRDMSK
jgi:hypothetical protein